MGGWSYGGYFSGLAATQHSKRFKAAMVGAAITNWVSFTGTSEIEHENTLVHWDLWVWDEPELAWMRRMALRINAVLRPHMLKRDLLLVDFKLEFGRAGGRLYLGDEISPDTCRLWDRATREKLDKDRFRRDLGGVEDAYQEVYRRLVGA